MFLVSLLIYFIYIVFFGIIYYSFLGNSKHWYGLNCDMTLMNAIYFASTTASTTGYGRISPKTSGSKIVVIFNQALTSIGLISIFLGHLIKWR